MQRRLKKEEKTGEGNSQRPRVGVSLDPDVYEWIKSFEGPSLSFNVSRILRAAMNADLKIEDAQAPSALEDFAAWLQKQRNPSRVAKELQVLLNKYNQSK